MVRQAHDEGFSLSLILSPSKDEAGPRTYVSEY